MGYPECKHSIWLPPEIIKSATIVDEQCPKCGPGFKKIKFHLKSTQHLSALDIRNVFDRDYITCLVCDLNLQELCNISKDSVKLNVNTSLRTNNSSNVATNNNNNARQSNNTSSRNSSSNRNTAPTTTYVNPNSRASWTNTSNSFREPQPPPPPRNQPNNRKRPATDTNDDIVYCQKCKEPARK